MATSPQHGSNILGPASINSLNRREDNVQSQKRRKRDDGDGTSSFSIPFTATALPESLHPKRYTFVPVARLSRAQVPLAWLDTSTSKDTIQSGLLFQAIIPYADNEALRTEAPTLLVVRSSPGEGLYVAETVGDNSYIAFRLAAWVTEKHILRDGEIHGQAPKHILHELLGAHGERDLQEHHPIRHYRNVETGIPVAPSPKKPKNRRGVLARMSILPAKEESSEADTDRTLAIEQSMEVGNYASEEKENTTPTSIVECCDSALDDSTSPITASGLQRGAHCQASDDACLLTPVSPDPEEVINNLQQQYLEMLYISKTSLAYFAKGPLSRARTQVQLCDITQEFSPFLVEFYRESIISAKKLDLKYMETIPRFIQDIPLTEATGTKKETSIDPVPRRRTWRKNKIGKNGMYPAEDLFLTKWWHARLISEQLAPTAESQSREVRNLIGQLRNRETEMQILLILEALALELPSQAKPKKEETKPAIKVEAAEQTEKEVLIRTPVAKKKKRDLDSDLDILLDRLCIWHTIGVDDIFTATDKAPERNATPAVDIKDRLRDFCADVVIPFYASRLPGPCKTICRKLGGPEVSQKRVKPVAVSSSRRARPATGLALKPQHRSISNQTLKTMIGEDQSFRNASPPILSRSSTAPLIPGLKRETTEPLRRPGSRAGIQKSRSFVGREIDLVADARAQESKRKKLENLAEQKRQLDAAIDALRKPNRELAGKAIMEDVAKRSAEKDPKKSCTIGRAMTGLGVQVTATPKKRKLMDDGYWQPNLHAIPATVAVPGQSSNEDSIPSSAARHPTSAENPAAARTLTRKRGVLVAVGETPSLGPAKRSNPLGLVLNNRVMMSSMKPPFSDGQHQTAASLSQLPETHETPSNQKLRRDSVMRPRSSESAATLKEAGARLDVVFRDAPDVPEKAGKAMNRVMGGEAEMSIYESLGWNDDIDDLI